LYRLGSEWIFCCIFDIILNPSHRFVCRCLKKLEELEEKNGKTYEHISLLNYGECWTTEETMYDLSKLGTDDTCIGTDFQTCENQAESECFGTAESQYVYHIHHEAESIEDELKFLHSECKIETLTVCTSPSTLHASSTAHP
jgi:hypothetical protein